MITFFTAGPFASDSDVKLGGDPLQHARARRVERGDAARLLDGRGRVGTGEIVEIGKRELTVRVVSVVQTPRPTEIEIVMPVADRDRMLLAAEKCAELQITGWRPAVFARSRSVSPRGEGDRFREKVQARMQAALEQSGGAWLPEIHMEVDLESALGAVPATWDRLVLDSRGTSYASRISRSPLAIAVGPEGGLEPSELEMATRSGWIPCAIAETTLRFETAAIAAVAAARAAQFRSVTNA